ncbi:MAG: hypothetical protein IJP04_01235, partial [Clostridia bacterium]|nr:hypothetical protein [Clostridia bacterium]
MIGDDQAGGQIVFAAPAIIFMDSVSDVLKLSDEISSPEVIVKIISNDNHGMRNSTSMKEVK